MLLVDSAGHADGLVGRSEVQIATDLLGIAFVFRKLGLRVEPVADTMVACATAYPDFPKGLDFITSIWTREPYYKDEGKK
jgi:hypothetical protein